MKRSRVKSPVAESSAGAARRVCTREDDTAHRDGDSTFFFIRLPNGKTITADMPLSSTVEELVQYLEHKVGCIKTRHCLVVGKHTAQLDEPLCAAGVSRDCTVQIQLTRVQTAYDCYNQQHDNIRQLLHRQPLLEPTELVASLTRVIGWLVPSEGGDLWKTAVGFSEAGDLAKTAQDAVAACCSLGNHPKSSPAEVETAIVWLHLLLNWAYEGILHASKAQYGELNDTPVPVSVQRIECSEVERVVELWLMATAAVMQVTLYSSKLRESRTGVNDVLETHLCKLSKVAGDVAQWLDEPIDPATFSWLNSRENFVLTGCALPAASWCTNGRATLLYLRKKIWDLSVTPIAALMQGITAMWADHLVSCYQHALKSLPGLINMLPATAAISSSSRIAGISSPVHTAAHRASNICVPSESVLLSLAHASLLVDPELQGVAKGLATTVRHFEGPGILRWRLYLGARAPAPVVHQVVQSLKQSAVHRLLVGGEVREADCKRLLSTTFTIQEGHWKLENPFFGGSHRAVWDFMPLITTALDSIKAFADFASLHNITQSAAGLPELLRTDGALLKLIQSWLLLGKLAATPPAAVHDGMTDSAAEAAAAAQSGKLATASYDGMVEGVAELLQHPLVKKWLDLKSSGLRPSTASDAEGYVVMQALMNLIAWCPRLAGAIPTNTRTRWMQEMLFPRHPAITNDDDDNDDYTESEIDVRRASILEDSYSELLSLDSRDLRAGIRVAFVGEEAEGEGVLREWLVQLAGQVFSPMAALFECGATDMSVQHPSAAAIIQTDWRKYFRLAGRVVGLALRHRVPLGVQLSSAFYKALQSIEADSGKGLPHNDPWMTAMTAFNSSKQPQQQQQWESWGAAADARGAMVVKVTHVDSQAWCSGFRFVARPWRVQTNLEDLQQMDLQVASSLQHILDTPCAVDDLALNWTGPAPAVPGDVGNEVTEVELVSGGAELAVNEDNKSQFVEARTEHKLLGGCTEQALWFYVGLSDIAEPKTLDLCQGRLLLPLTVTDFNSHLCGSRSELTVPAWQAATTLSSSIRSPKRQPVVNMFWEVVGDLDQHQRRQLLRFWTGITHLPASGFSGLGRKLQIMALTHTEAAAAQAPAAAEADQAAAAAEAPAAAEDGQAAAAAENNRAAAAVEAPAAAAEGEQAAAAENEQTEAEGEAVISALDAMDVDMGSEEEHDQPASAEGDHAQSAAAVADVGSASAEVGQPAEQAPGQVTDLGDDASIAADAGAGGTAVDGRPNTTRMQAITRRVQAVERRLAELEARTSALGDATAVQTVVQSAIARINASTSSRAGTVAQHNPVVLQLPRAHTCFMQLLLPVGYQNAAEMRRALLVALENVDYFGTA